MDVTPARTDIRSDLVAFLPKLRRFALTLCQDTAKVDALVAKACAQAIQKAPSWKGETRLEVRLFAFVRVVARQEMHKVKTADKETNHRPAKNTRTLSGHFLIETLSVDCAATFLLCAAEGLNYREAAAVMGTSEDAIAQTMLAARRELRVLTAESSERRA